MILFPLLLILAYWLLVLVVLPIKLVIWIVGKLCHRRG